MNQVNEPLKNVDERQASKILGLAVQTLRNLRFRREGPNYCKFGRSVRYPITDLREYIEAHKIQIRNVSDGN